MTTNANGLSLPRLHAARVAPMALALLGVCIAAVIGLWMQRMGDAEAAADFGRSAKRVAEVVESRIKQPVYGLNGARGMYASSERDVHRREFRAYVASRDLPREFPGVRGFGFIERVDRGAVPAFVAAEQADGELQFAVHAMAASDHDHLYVIKYIEPAATNAAALGLDIGSEPNRREAAERAMTTGRPTLSAAITLVQDSQQSAGFLLFVPVYKTGAAPTTPAKRLEALVGLLFAPMVVGEILATVPEVASGQVHFQLRDAAGGKAIFDSREVQKNGPKGAASTRRESRFQTELKVSLPGREATVTVRSTPQFDAAHDNASPWIVFAGGALASALLSAALAYVLRQQASLRSRAEALAASLTTDLERLAQVVRHTRNAVLTTDLEQRINWVNEGFTQLTGYSRAQALGQTVEAVLGTGTADTPAHRVLAAAIAAGHGCRVELLHRASDGRELWLDLDVQPLLDARGALTGFMRIGSDVTQQRQAQKQLENALRATDALLRVVNTHAIVSVADRAGRIVEANDAFCRISGYSREELLQQTHRIVNSGVQPASFWVEMWHTIAA